MRSDSEVGVDGQNLIRPGDLVEHRVGHGRGIYVSTHKCFVVGDDWDGLVAWNHNDIKPVGTPPPDDMWAAYCAWQLSGFSY